ncbi:MAG: EAL domain-containing protein [Methylophilaceae bacterium]
MNKNSLRLRNPQPGNIIFWLATVTLLLIFTTQHFTMDKAWLSFFDNLHWTVSNAAAAAMAWLGFAQSTGPERAARGWFSAGLAASLTGQLMWDIEGHFGWHTFPAPSDIGYLLLGVCCLLGLLAALNSRQAKHPPLATALDALILSISSIALILAVYLAQVAHVDQWNLSVMAAYPAIMLSAALFGVLLVIHLRPQLHWSWLLLLIGLGCEAIFFMCFNVRLLSSQSIYDSLLNLLFSVAIIIIGVSAMHWRMVPSHNTRYEKWCENILRMLPLVGVVVVAMAALFILTLDSAHIVLKSVVLLAAILVLMLAMLRQSLLLNEREQLLVAEKAVSESRALLQVVMDTAPVGVFWKDRDSRYLGCNTAFARDAGTATAADIIGKDDYQLDWKKLADLFRSEDAAVIQSGVPEISNDVLHTSSQGHPTWYSISKVPLRNSHNEIIGVFGVHTDITQRKLAEESSRIAAMAFETHEAIMITDADKNILRVNRSFEKTTGYAEVEVTGKDIRSLRSEQHDEEFYAEMWQTVANTGSWSGELWSQHKSGNIYPAKVTLSAVRKAQGDTTHYVAIFSNISERKKTEQRIQTLAFNDALTGLPNRRFIMDRLRRALTAAAQSLQYGAVLLLDLDRFQMLNDTQGHDRGDRLLIEVAQRLKPCLAEPHNLARIGGDEFMIILENLGENIEGAQQVVAEIAEKIRAILAIPYQTGDNTHYGSASIGACLFDGNNTSANVLIKQADMAMYAAKNAGRNCVRFFDAAMQSLVESSVMLESDLHGAISHQQLQLHYQLQLDLNRRPIGAEALIRWIHPQRGMVSPAQFIPVAEQSGLILDIGQWVLDTACQQIAAWSHNEKTRYLVLAINISAAQFAQLNFVDQIETAIRKHCIEPSRLKLELTESVVLDDLQNVVLKMLTLKQQIGVTLSLDDFGTGYSSLSYLKRLPLDQIKIDQSFVRDMTEDANDAVMVKTIIDMARNFNLNVIAEGVETEAQFALLKEYQCLGYQGYLFSKPVPVEQFEALLEQDL